MNLQPRRSLHDIRSMGDRVSEAEKPQRKFIRLAILELEKVRRNKEKLRAAQRVEEIEQRLDEISGEQTDLLAAVHLGPPRRELPAGPPQVTDVPESSGSQDFRLTY